MIDTRPFVAHGPGTGPVLSIAVDVPASAPELFRAWTTVEGIRSFFGRDARIDLRIGGPYEILFDLDAPDGSRGSEGCRVLAWLENRLLVVSWSAPPDHPETRPLRTWVVIELDPGPLGGTTRCTLRHTGFGEGPAWDETRRYFQSAWRVVLTRLASRFGASTVTLFDVP